MKMRLDVKVCMRNGLVLTDSYFEYSMTGCMVALVIGPSKVLAHLERAWRALQAHTLTFDLDLLIPSCSVQ